MLKAAKSCFAAIVEVSGILIPKEETSVRPDRQGLKVAEVLADAGETVTAGQTLARLTLPEGGTDRGAGAGRRAGQRLVGGDRLHRIGQGRSAVLASSPRSEFDLVGLVPVRDLSKLAVNQSARVKIIGAGEVDGKVRRVASTVEPNSQLGQVFVALTLDRRLLVNASGRAHDQDRPELRRRRCRSPRSSTAAPAPWCRW